MSMNVAVDFDSPMTSRSHRVTSRRNGHACRGVVWQSIHASNVVSMMRAQVGGAGHGMKRPQGRAHALNGWASSIHHAVLDSWRAAQGSNSNRR